MMVYRLNDQLFIKESNGVIVWIEMLDSEDDVTIVIEGDCTIDEHRDMLFLSSWKETYPLKEHIDIKNVGCWDKTNYYAVLSESGNMKIYSAQSGNEVTNDEFKQLVSDIGCTMKYK